MAAIIWGIRTLPIVILDVNLLNVFMCGGSSDPPGAASGREARRSDDRCPQEIFFRQIVKLLSRELEDLTHGRRHPFPVENERNFDACCAKLQKLQVLSQGPGTSESALLIHTYSSVVLVIVRRAVTGDPHEKENTPRQSGERIVERGGP